MRFNGCILCIQSIECVYMCMRDMWLYCTCYVIKFVRIHCDLSLVQVRFVQRTLFYKFTFHTNGCIQNTQHSNNHFIDKRQIASNKFLNNVHVILPFNSVLLTSIESIESSAQKPWRKFPRSLRGFHFVTKVLIDLFGIDFAASILVIASTSSQQW